jgi:hypothetical protein
MQIGRYVKRYTNPKRVIRRIVIPKRIEQVPQPQRVPLTPPERGQTNAQR